MRVTIFLFFLFFSFQTVNAQSLDLGYLELTADDSLVINYNGNDYDLHVDYDVVDEFNQNWCSQNYPWTDDPCIFYFGDAINDIINTQESYNFNVYEDGNFLNNTTFANEDNQVVINGVDFDNSYNSYGLISFKTSTNQDLFDFIQLSNGQIELQLENNSTTTQIVYIPIETNLSQSNCFFTSSTSICTFDYSTTSTSTPIVKIRFDEYIYTLGIFLFFMGIITWSHLTRKLS